jgi:hypothetical protein
VGDEVLAGAAPLVGVVLAGEDERRLDRVAVDRDRRLGGVLLDDREQVAEQPPLGLGQLGALARARAWVLDAVDGRPGRDQRRSPVAVTAGLRRRGLGVAVAGTPRRRGGSAQAVALGFALLRNRRPSSYRAV